jgi:hypothetical protein
MPTNYVHGVDHQYQLKKGLATDINITNTVLSAILAEPHYATDSRVLYLFDGTINVPLVSCLPLVTISGNYSPTLLDYVILCNATVSGIILTLPTISGITSKAFCIKKIDSSLNSITISGIQNIDGDTTQVLENQYDSITIVAGTAEWSII